MATRVRSLLVVAMLALMHGLASRARADVVGSIPLRGCPLGSNATASHDGYGCAAWTCDYGCNDDQHCAPRRLCEVRATFGRWVVESCAPGESCDGLRPSADGSDAGPPECRVVDVCLPNPMRDLSTARPASPEPSSCRCGVSDSGRAPALLWLVPALVLATRRRASRPR